VRQIYCMSESAGGRTLEEVASAFFAEHVAETAVAFVEMFVDSVVVKFVVELNVVYAATLAVAHFVVSAAELDLDLES